MLFSLKAMPDMFRNSVGICMKRITNYLDCKNSYNPDKSL